MTIQELRLQTRKACTVQKKFVKFAVFRRHWLYQERTYIQPLSNVALHQPFKPLGSNASQQTIAPFARDLYDFTLPLETTWPCRECFRQEYSHRTAVVGRTPQLTEDQAFGRLDNELRPFCSV